MDNAIIHHDEALVELIKETGSKVVYLPPYLPDFNLIETAFLTLKAWFKRYRNFVEIWDDIKYLILLHYKSKIIKQKYSIILKL